MAEETKKDLGYAFNYIADFGAGQQLQVTGSLPVGVTEAEIAAEVKKFRNVVEKNRSQSGLRDLQDKVNAAKKQLISLEETLAEADDRHSGKSNIPTNEKVAREQTVTGIKHWRVELVEAERILEERKKELE